MADRMDLLSVGPNPRSRPSAVLHNFELPSETVHPVQFVFCSRVNVQEKIMREDWSQSKTFLVAYTLRQLRSYDNLTLIDT